MLAPSFDINLTQWFFPALQHAGKLLCYSCGFLPAAQKCNTITMCGSDEVRSFFLIYFGHIEFYFIINQQSEIRKKKNENMEIFSIRHRDSNTASRIPLLFSGFFLGGVAWSCLLFISGTVKYSFVNSFCRSFPVYVWYGFQQKASICSVCEPQNL